MTSSQTIRSEVSFFSGVSIGASWLILLPHPLLERLKANRTIPVKQLRDRYVLTVINCCKHGVPTELSFDERGAELSKQTIVSFFTPANHYCGSLGKQSGLVQRLQRSRGLPVG